MAAPSHLAPSRSVGDLAHCIHPTENSRFWLAVGIVTPITLLFLTLTLGMALLLVPLLLLGAWVSVRIFRAHLLGSSAEVSPDNFPEVHELLQQICQSVGYPKKVEAYVYQDGEVNAFLVKRFRTRIILLPHELLVDMLDNSKRAELVWVLGRAVGHLKAKHLRLQWLQMLVDAYEKLFFLNLFLYPWERATQYSGDRIGLHVCSDLDAAVRAMSKLMLGNKLADRASLVGLLKQRLRLASSFFAWVAECSSAHPHLTKRVESLISWCRYNDPPTYESFLNSQVDTASLEHFLSPQLVERGVPTMKLPAGSTTTQSSD